MKNDFPPIALALLIAVFLVAPASAKDKKPETQASAAGFETRCGWVSNPTPANWDLSDKDGEWVIGVQGGHQVEGDLPAFPENKTYWVNTNGHYGYGCGCLQVKVDGFKKTVLQIKGGRALPLARCRADKSLKSENR